MTDLTSDIGRAEVPAIEWFPHREPGVYFGEPEDVYHDQRNFSTSGIKYMLASPTDYWARSWMNPLHEPVDSSAMREGTAWHKRILEGAASWLAMYAADIDPADHPLALRTIDQMDAALAKITTAKPARPKAKLVAQIVAAAAQRNMSVEIWDDVVAKHAAETEGRELIKPEIVRRIEMQAAMIERHPVMSKMFSGGYPEVSIYWEDPETGVPMKCRVDYLKIGAIVDLKTFSNPHGRPIDRAICTAMANYRYHIQAAVYDAGVAQAADLIREGKVHGDVDPEWLARFADYDHAARKFLFVFQQTGPAPVARAKIFPRNLTHDCGKVAAEQAIADFRAHWQHFGESPWVDLTEMSAFDDADFPSYMVEA